MKTLIFLILFHLSLSAAYHSINSVTSIDTQDAYLLTSVNSIKTPSLPISFDNLERLDNCLVNVDHTGVADFILCNKTKLRFKAATIGEIDISSLDSIIFASIPFFVSLEHNSVILLGFLGVLYTLLLFLFSNKQQAYVPILIFFSTLLLFLSTVFFIIDNNDPYSLFFENLSEKHNTLVVPDF